MNIFVITGRIIDSSDTDGYVDGPEPVLQVTRSINMDVPLLIFANKCDLSNSKPILKILEQIQAHHTKE